MMAASALANGFASFLSSPHVEVEAASAPEPVAAVREPIGSYGRFDLAAGTVDMRIRDENDEGHSEWSVICAIMEGDAALPKGPFKDIAIHDRWAIEMDNDVDQKFAVLGMDSVIGIDWCVVLKGEDEDVPFSKVQVGGLTYEQLRDHAHESVSRWLAGKGAWHCSYSTIEGGDMIMTIVPGEAVDG